MKSFSYIGENEMELEDKVQTYNISIIFADDNIDLCKILKIKLERKGYRVETYISKVDALIEFKKRQKIGEKTDLIISDIQSPVMDGYEFLGKIRECDQEVKFMFLTTKRRREDILKAVEMGADKYFTKPYDMDQIYEGIESILVERD
jgi:DNA-binding response OmpR family regulator